MKLSLSFQGGGARVVELAAAANAIQDIVDGDKERFDVIRAAGTSAGAISAAMYATGVDFQRIRRHRNELDQLIRSSFPDFSRGRSVSLFNLLRGRPLVNELVLKKVLRKIFELGGVDGDLELKTLMNADRTRCPEIRLLYSSLTDAKTKYHDERSNVSLLEALIDSSALPFVFRVPRDRFSKRIDGGLFQNLPGRAAKEGLGDDVAAYAIVFDEPPAPDVYEMSIFHYAGYILNRIIAERARDSALYFQSENIISLKSDASTLGFREMFGDQFEKNFNAQYEAVSRRFDEIKRGKRETPEPDYHSDAAPDLIYRLNKIETDAREFSNAVIEKFRAKKLKQEIISLSLTDRTQPVLISSELTFAGEDNPGRQFFRLHFFDCDEGALRAPEVSARVTTVDGNVSNLDVLVVPIRQSSHRSRPLLVCLSRPIVPGEELVLQKTERSHGMMDDYLSSGKTYWQSVLVGEDRTFESLEIVHYFPDGYAPDLVRPGTSNSFDPTMPGKAGKDFELLQPSSIVQDEKPIIPGTVAWRAEFGPVSANPKQQLASLAFIR